MEFQTVIGKMTVIKGQIETKENLRIDGGVEGNVSTESDLEIAGTVKGDVDANDMTLTSASVSGNIMATGNVKIDDESLVIGDISAADVEISGSVKGDIECTGGASIKDTAIIYGNVTSARCKVEEGAVVKGQLINSDDSIDIDEYFNSRNAEISLELDNASASNSDDGYELKGKNGAPASSVADLKPGALDFESEVLETTFVEGDAQ